MSTQPTDKELDALFSEHWPAFDTIRPLARLFLRNAMRAAVAKWGAAPKQAAQNTGKVTADQRVEWLLSVQPVAEVDGLGHFVTAWLTESRSPTGKAGYFMTRGKTHIECVDRHILGQGKEV